VQKRCDSQLCLAGFVALANVGSCNLHLRQPKVAMLAFDV
jgi:hypothetical protein